MFFSLIDPIQIPSHICSPVIKKKRSEKNYLKLPVPPKAKEVHYKILSGVYPSKEFLRRRFAIDDNCCSFCNGVIESTEHLFYDCIFCKALWIVVHYWLLPKIPNLLEFSKNDIMFGSLRKEV